MQVFSLQMRSYSFYFENNEFIKIPCGKYEPTPVCNQAYKQNKWHGS